MNVADVDVKIDRKSGDFFLPKLKEARQRLWIISPWVGSAYMDLALSKKEAGVDVKVITSNDYVLGQKEALRRLVEGHTRITKPSNTKLKVVGLSLVIGGILLALLTKGLTLVFTVAGLITFVKGMERSETYWISKLGEGNLKVLHYSPYKIVHAKVYIADDTVIMGSANLTENGVKRNIEGMAIIRSAELATKLGQTMATMESSLNLRQVPYNTLGRELRTC
jgi:phosphatidylserine/phosphatidylglycerophosphate/cardiolipin synthase-like enzyme